MDSVVLNKNTVRRYSAATPLGRIENTDYFAIMCHEIGTPLAAIIGLSHILTSTEATSHQKKECEEMLRVSANMLQALVKNMLVAAKVEAGMISLEYTKFDLRKLVCEAVHILSLRALEKNLDLEVDIESGLTQQWVGDPLHIQQILVNLLSNAIKFTDTGKVTVCVCEKVDQAGNDYIQITVTDTGIGISENTCGRLFSKYAQESAGNSRKYGGTGLGLFISQELAQLMRGNITVTSVLGVGSSFLVTLPIQKANT